MADLEELKGKLILDTTGYTEGVDKAKEASKEMGQEAQATAAKVKAASVSMKDSAIQVGKGFAALSTSIFTAYASLKRWEDSSHAIDKANLTVQRSTEAVDHATKNLQEAIAKYGSGSAEAADAADALSIAQQKLELDTDSLRMRQDDQNMAMMTMAVMAVPAVITGIEGMTKAYEGLKGLKMAGAFDGITSALGNHYDSLVSAGIAAGALFGLYGAFTTDSEGMRVALSLITGAMIAAGAAQWFLNSSLAAFLELSTMGLATAVIATALVSAGVVYAAASLYKPTTKAAKGGIVLPKPGGTPVLVGEAGQAEAIIPLDGRGIGGNITINNTFYEAVDGQEVGRQMVAEIKRSRGLRA
jgi:hypothetical protein